MKNSGKPGGYVVCFGRVRLKFPYRREFMFFPQPAIRFSFDKPIKAYRPDMFRLRKHQRDAMARGQVNDLVNVGRFYKM